jgi:branched-chain amino acid aminotransferase
MPSDKTRFVYINDQLQPFDQAYLHISDISVQRGYGIFDFLKMEGVKAFFLEDYLNRFYQSAELLELKMPVSRDILKARVTTLAEHNQLKQSGIKLILTGGYSENGYDPGEPNLIIIQQPLILPDEAKITKGIRIITYEYAREMARAKTINYITGIRLIKQLKENNAEDVLYHLKGEVLEFPRCNFFIVKNDGTIVTPDQGILHGITRKNILELAGKKYNTETGIVTLTDVAQAREAFLSSTTKRILPIVEVDGQQIGNGKPGTVTLELLQDLIKLENEHIHNLK